MNAAVVRKILEGANVQFALIGAAAVALRGLPRFTQDTDFFTTDRRVLQPTLWAELIGAGELVDIRESDFEDPLGGEPMDLFGGSIPVPTRSDLILLKLAAGGYKDLIDAAGLLSLGPRHELIDEINSRIGDLPADARTQWAKLAG